MSEEQTLAKVEPTYSQRFTNMVVREFGQVVGNLEMSPYQERLAQHLFIGVDMALKKLEVDRLKKDANKLPVIWSNVNMEKLAIDAVHRVELGLDALIPNHIHTIPYLNGKTKKYDLDLQIGYVGKDYYKRKMAINPPSDIIYHLVHENDTFEPMMKSAKNACESYKFEISDPFARGAVVGGFGYITYDDPALNQLVIVPKASFDKSQKKAQSTAFWAPYTEEMQMVALVRRVTAKLNIDPEKTNTSFMQVEIDDAIRMAEQDRDENANGDIVDIEPGKKESAETPGSTTTTGVDPPIQWDPCTSKLQQRYPADKVTILKAECKKRNINISGLLPKQAHDVLLKAIKEAEEMKERTTQEGTKNDKIYLHCPEYEDRRPIELCETDKCGKFATCDIAQDTINEAIAKTSTEEGTNGTGTEKPEF